MKKSILTGVFLLSLFSVWGEKSLTNGELSINLKEKPLSYGWADIGKLSYSTSAPFVIDDKNYPDPKDKKKALVKALSSGNKLILLSGDVDLNDALISDNDHSYYDEFSNGTHQRLHGDNMFSISSNITLIGLDKARIMFGGFTIDSASNIIIRNVEFWDAHGSTELDTAFSKNSKASIDAIAIKGSAQNIWIDHCTFSDGLCDDMIRNYNHDGLLDIVSGKKVTVSYCEFKNHDKVMLVGSSEKALNPSEREVTLHHNYFHKTTQRTPRTRGTYMHIYNNVYDEIGVKGNPGYCLGPGTNAQFIVENNYFGSCLGVIVSWGFVGKNKSKITKYYESGNNIQAYLNQAASIEDMHESVRRFIVDKPSWEIKYEYKSNLQSWEEAKSTVLSEAGAGKIVKIEN